MKRKKLLSIFLTLALLCGLLPMAALPAAATDTWDGTTKTEINMTDHQGTSDDPYEISTGAQLAWLATQVNTRNTNSNITGKYFVLTDDINLNNENWTPIGKAIQANSTAFGGTLDGQGHTIRGLSISVSNTDLQGLFGAINGGSVKNLTVEGAVTVSDTDSSKSKKVIRVGGLTGYTSNSTFENVTTIVTVTATRSTNVPKNTSETIVGGLAGKVVENTTFTRCANRGAITGPYHVGGLVGVFGDEKNFSGRLVNCCNTGAVTKEDNSGATETKWAGCVGGLVGWAQMQNQDNGSEPAVVGCYNSGAVTDNTPHSLVTPGSTENQQDWLPPYSAAGGLFGYLKVAAPGAVGNTLDLAGCYNTGAVNGGTADKKTIVGGLAGYTAFKSNVNESITGGAMTLTDFYNTGAITAASGERGAVFGIVRGISSNNADQATYTLSKSYYLSAEGLNAIGMIEMTDKVTDNSAPLSSNALKTAVKDGKLSKTYFKTGAAYPILTWQPDEVYAVTVSGSAADDVTAEATATAGQDYSFTVTKDASYDYEVSATVSETAVTLTEGDNGYTIAAADVTGAIAITANKTEAAPPAPTTYDVTVSGSAAADVTAATTATVGSAFSFTVTKADSYDYTVSVTVGSTTVTPSESNGTYTIAAADITGAITITANKTLKTYDVTVSGSAAADVTAATTATAGSAFSFTVTKADSYDYTVSVTVGSTTVTPSESNGTYTIAAADVTGAITITANKTLKTYDVTVSGSAAADVTAATTATAGSAFSFTVTKADSYDYTVSVTVGSTAVTPSESNGTYTIAAADITGAITITANKTLKTYAVTVGGSAAADVTAATTATAGSAFSFTVTKAEGYDYTVSVTVGATAVTPSESNGTYTIAAADVTGAITITAEKTLKSFTVKFVNADGTELSSAQYAYGTAADSITKPVDPTKASTTDKVFTFGGWTPALAEVTGDATYTATYTEATRKYTIKFVNADGTVLQSSEVEYGQTPTYTGATPTKAETASYTYSFKGWDKTIAAVSGEATYTATFTSNAKSSDTGSSGSTVTTPAAQPETTRTEESETAADGSEITTVTEKTEDSKTNADGSVTDTSSEKTTETVSAPDGSKTVTETVAKTEITTGTVQNDDGSVTETVASATKETAKETVTDADGNVTETVTETEVKKNVETTVDADGKTSGSGTVETTTTVTDEAGNVLSTAVTEGEISISTAEDGVVSEVTKAKTTITDVEGNVTEETTVTTEAVAPDGSSATVVEDGEGNTLRAEANVSEQAYQAAKESGSPIMIPVTVNPDSEAAISVEMPEMQEGETAQVEIGLTRTGPGVVAYVLRNGEKSLDKTCRLGSLIVTVEGDSELVIIDNDKSFDDVDADKWYGFSVSFVTAREIFNGNGNGTFSPRGRMNRAMVAQVLYNLCRGAEAGNGAVFSDVAESAWYFEAVGWAAENKLIEGWNGAYAPLTSVTRQDLVTILYRYVKFAGYDVAGVGDGVDLGVYGDGAEVSDYAAEAMRWAVGSGLIQGYTDNTLHPKDTATRAEVAALIQRMITEIVK